MTSWFEAAMIQIETEDSSVLFEKKSKKSF